MDSRIDVLLVRECADARRELSRPGEASLSQFTEREKLKEKESAGDRREAAEKVSQRSGEELLSCSGWKGASGSVISDRRKYHWAVSFLAICFAVVGPSSPRIERVLYRTRGICHE